MRSYFSPMLLIDFVAKYLTISEVFSENVKDKYSCI